MGSRLWQVFVAPGPESQELPTEASPWHSERWVRLPKEHWNLILDFAGEICDSTAGKLRDASRAADDNNLDEIHVTRGEIELLIRFLGKLSGEIARSPPLVPVATEEVPDRYVNEEHVRMVRAVIAVLQEAMRLSLPFRAWTE